MFALFHLIFEVFKISILSTIYATILLLLARFYSHFKPDGLLNRITKKKIKFWLLAGSTISIGLFFFLFTYWGNHGLGDDSFIPIGHGQTICNIDDAWTYFYPDPKKEDEQRPLGNYLIKNNKLCATGVQEDGKTPSDSTYLVYDLESKKYVTFKSEQEYSVYAKANNLPQVNEFYDFDTHYDEYWNRWRFWLLP